MLCLPLLYPCYSVLEDPSIRMAQCENNDNPECVVEHIAKNNRVDVFLLDDAVLCLIRRDSDTLSTSMITST